MHYVIQRVREPKLKHFLAYPVPRYISSPQTDNIIMEFIIEGKKVRKWAAKSDIILITEDEQLYRSTLEQLRTIEQKHLQQIAQAQKQMLMSENALESDLDVAFEAIRNSCPLPL